MAQFKELFRRKDEFKEGMLGVSTDAEDGPDLSDNDVTLRRQRLLLGTGGSVAALAALWWLLAPVGNDTPAGSEPQGEDIRISTDDLGSRNMSEKEWIAMSENRLQAQDNQLQRLQGQGSQVDQLQAQIDALRAQNANMENDGKQVLAAYESENAALKQQLSSGRGDPVPSAVGNRALYGASGPAAYQTIDQGTGPVMSRRPGDIKVINFGAGGAHASGVDGGVSPPTKSADRAAAIVTDSPNYLPANSFATARVIVGVDAASNVQSQADPLPVVLRITGPARSVADRGRVLKTRIEGCLVNGAARGDLSSEKVYVKLARMTCRQPNGRFAESEVKGFVAFGGKTGVRGRVVSREGSLAAQGFLAGLVGGIGRGASMNTDSYLNSTGTVINGQRPKLSIGDIAQAGLGEGIATTGDRVSKYLIERAEQYQPVIEMPTGIDVEIVFLDGAFVRN